MSKLAKMSQTPQVRSPIVTTGEITTTHEGGVGHVRDPKSELFLLAASNLVGEKTFYEGGKDRDVRFRDLVRMVASIDPGWVAGFAKYLRTELNMRSASAVMAAEYVASGAAGGRQVVSSVLVRPDEPAEMLGYWIGTYGRKIPAAVKRGVADALGRLYTERNTIKYDGKGQPIRFGDVVEIVHPKPKDEFQSALFKHLIDRRHNREDLDYTGLSLLAGDAATWAVPEAERGVARLPEGLASNAGMTWERYASWIGRKINAVEWEVLEPEMGLMAIVRNLRNIDEAGPSDVLVKRIEQRLRDPEDIRKSRQLPFRFYTAWREVASMRWGPALEDALNISLQNIPALQGRSLVLVDQSGSMFMGGGISERSTVKWGEIAAVFGSALALRGDADLFAYDNEARPIHTNKGGSVLRTVQNFPPMGGGTQTMDVIATLYPRARYDRIVIVTDEQAFAPGRGGPSYYEQSSADSYTQVAKIPVPIYTFNVAGHKVGHLPSGSDQRYTFGGLSDAAFTLLGLLESGKDGTWPWEA